MKRKNTQRLKRRCRAVRLLCAAFMLAVLSEGFGCGKKEAVLLQTVPIEQEEAEETGTEETKEKTGKETKAEESMILVHVCGAVVSPGVYELSEGSRVYEAVEAAGGMTEDAASDYLNMAGSLSDGSKITVPFLSALSEEERYGLSDDGDMKDTKEALVDINHADKEMLMTLPGIGEAKAEAVIAYRKEHGAFGSAEDIMLVPGIKEAAYEKLKDKITVR